MKLTSCGQFLSFLLSASYLAIISGLDTKFVRFQVFQKHRELKKCAISSMLENAYVGARTSMLTGECEVLNRYLGLEEPMENGYAYAKKMSVNETFQPPDEVHEMKLMIPGVLTTAARIDLVLSNSDIAEHPGLDITLCDPMEFFPVCFTIQVRETGLTIGEKTSDNRFLTVKDLFNNPPARFASMEGVRISLLPRLDSITVLMDDEELNTSKLYYNDVTRLSQIKIESTVFDGVRAPYFIHGFQYTGL